MNKTQSAKLKRRLGIIILVLFFFNNIVYIANVRQETYFDPQSGTPVIILILWITSLYLVPFIALMIFNLPIPSKKEYFITKNTDENILKVAHEIKMQYSIDSRDKEVIYQVLSRNHCELETGDIVIRIIFLVYYLGIFIGATIMMLLSMYD